jgi:hypothetical protein
MISGGHAGDSQLLDFSIQPQRIIAGSSLDFNSFGRTLKVDRSALKPRNSPDWLPGVG